MKRDPVIRCFLNFLFSHKYHLKTFQPTNTPPFSRMKQRSQQRLLFLKKKRFQSWWIPNCRRKVWAGSDMRGADEGEFCGSPRKLNQFPFEISNTHFLNFRIPSVLELTTSRKQAASTRGIWCRSFVLLKCEQRSASSIIRESWVEMLFVYNFHSIRTRMKINIGECDVKNVM